VQIANDSMYGLGGAVWSKNKDRALAIARQIQTGTVWINDYHMIKPALPLRRLQAKRRGPRARTLGLHAYQEIKHIHVARARRRRARSTSAHCSTSAKKGQTLFR